MIAESQMSFVTKEEKINTVISIVIVKTFWNAEIVDRLNISCVKELKNQCDNIKIKEIKVPGAAEIPFIIRQHAQKNINCIDAYIALGCVVKGDTPHFDFVCRMVSDGINTLNLTIDVPTIMGVLTVNNLEQARERVLGNKNKGVEFAQTAIKMVIENRKITSNKN